MLDAIAAWESRIEQPSRTPSPESSLADDDLAFSPLPAPLVAYYNLVTAVEHLHLYFFRTAFQDHRAPLSRSPLHRAQGPS
jgi:hypothetical protein